MPVGSAQPTLSSERPVSAEPRLHPVRPHLAAAADAELAQFALHARAGRVAALVVDALVVAQVAVAVERNPDHGAVGGLL